MLSRGRRDLQLAERVLRRKLHERNVRVQAERRVQHGLRVL
jgi:hypothetical protein